MKEAVQAVVQMQLNYMTFKSDSQIVVQTNQGDNSEFSLLILSIKNLLDCISNFDVKFVKCQVNLTKVINSKTKRNTFNLILPCIEQYLLNGIR